MPAHARRSSLTALFACLLAASTAHGASIDGAGGPTNPFERAGGIGLYGATWSGDYDATGLGGRARLEYDDTIGLDLFAEGYAVDVPGTRRADLVIGFNLFVPFAVLPRLRLRPLFGFCADFSFTHPTHDADPVTDDIGFGIHAGGGIEVGLGSDWSIFADAQQVLWFTNDHRGGDWTQAGGALHTSTLTQASLGVQIHLF